VHRREMEQEPKPERRRLPLLAPTIYGIGALFTAIVARTLATLGGIGDQVQPGQIRSGATSLAVIAGILNVIFTVPALYLSWSPPRRWQWIAPLAVTLAMTLTGCLLFHHAVGAEWVYREKTAGGSPGWAENDLAYAEFLLVATPFLAITANGFRRGSSRIFICAAAIASLGFLIDLIVFAQGYLD
jgi:hypothetical protein